MDTMLKKPFRSMGARVRVVVAPQSTAGSRRAPGEGRRLSASAAHRLLDGLRVDIGRDAAGEYFEVRCDPRVRLGVVDVRKRDRLLHEMLKSSA